MRPVSAFALLGLCALVGLSSPAFSNDKTADNPNGCNIVERKGGTPPGTISSSVSAGGGHVSASTSAGNGVTVYSGNGNSVATAGTSSDGHSSTMVTSGNGDCTIYVDPGQKKADQQ